MLSRRGHTASLFIYQPSTDEIFLRDGRCGKRPPEVPIAKLAGASYEGYYTSSSYTRNRHTQRDGQSEGNGGLGQKRERTPSQFETKFGGELVYLSGTGERGSGLTRITLLSPADGARDLLRMASYHGQLRWISVPRG